MRYYVTNNNLIPLHEQPSQGYTKLQAIARCQREACECVKLFNIKMSEAVKWFHVVDNKFRYCKDLDNCI